MHHSQFDLLKGKRFLPLFVTQFLGAFHDNLFKNALVVLMLYGASVNAVAIGRNRKHHRFYLTAVFCPNRAHCFRIISIGFSGGNLIEWHHVKSNFSIAIDLHA